MPDRYADVLAEDIAVSMFQRGSIRTPGVTIAARGRLKKRKVVRLNEGFLTHPLFGDRERWFTQTDGMKPGFFNDPCARSGPQARARTSTAIQTGAARAPGGPYRAEPP